MKHKLSKKSAFLLGISLFSMFFGSGNLIFPPYLGFQAGESTAISLAGFAVTAILFPVLAVIVIAKAGDLMTLSKRVNEKFAYVFTIIVFLALGPGLAIPRNAAVSFEMAVYPFVGNVTTWIRVIYSLLFFGISFIMSVKPESVVDWLGKILGPLLIVMMIAISIGCFTGADWNLLPAAGDYADGQFIQGFLDGYNTMDTLAALNFGNLIALNIMSKGVKEKKTVVRYVVHAGWIAGIFLLVIYTMLAYVGALSGGMNATAANGANVLTNIVSSLFGTPGVIFLGIIYILSCLTTCVGLMCSCAEYFTSISRLSYTKWVLIFTIAGFAFSVVGLNQLLTISVPFLTGVYPIAMVLVILGLCDEKIKKYDKIYSTTIFVTTIVSVIYGLNAAGIVIPFVTNAVLSIPPTADLCWVIPAILGAVLGILRSKK